MSSGPLVSECCFRYQLLMVLSPPHFFFLVAVSRSSRGALLLVLIGFLTTDFLRYIPFSVSRRSQQEIASRSYVHQRSTVLWSPLMQLLFRLAAPSPPQCSEPILGALFGAATDLLHSRMFGFLHRFWVSSSTTEEDVVLCVRSLQLACVLVSACKKQVSKRRSFVSL